MANKYLSGVLLLLVSCSIFLGSSSEAARLYTADENIESFALSKVFGLLDSVTGAFKNGLAAGSNLLRLLSGDPSKLSSDQVHEIDEGFEHLQKAAKEIKMVHGLLTAFLLWPLALILCCPVSCFLGCLVGCLIIVVVAVVAIVLFLVGLLLYTPGVADGALPYNAASTAEMVAQTLSDMCRESLHALEKISENGHKWPVSIALDAAQFIMEQIENAGGQAQALLARAENANDQVREKLESVDDILQTLLADVNEKLTQLKKGEEPVQKAGWFGFLYSEMNSQAASLYNEQNSAYHHGRHSGHRRHRRRPHYESDEQ